MDALSLFLHALEQYLDIPKDSFVIRTVTLSTRIPAIKKVDVFINKQNENKSFNVVYNTTFNYHVDTEKESKQQAIEDIIFNLLKIYKNEISKN